MAAILNLAAILDSGIAMTPHAHVLDLHKIVAVYNNCCCFSFNLDEITCGNFVENGKSY